MSDRTILKNRRFTETVEFETLPRMTSPSISYRAGLGYFEDGRLAEVFLSAGKAGTDLNIQAHETAIAVSKALEYGCPAEELRTAMPRTAEGKPEGAVGTLLDILRDSA